MAHRRGFELLTKMPKDPAMVPLNENATTSTEPSSNPVLAF
jgi:hypothetical protein